MTNSTPMSDNSITPDPSTPVMPPSASPVNQPSVTTQSQPAIPQTPVIPSVPASDVTNVLPNVDAPVASPIAEQITNIQAAQAVTPPAAAPQATPISSVPVQNAQPQSAAPSQIVEQKMTLDKLVESAKQTGETIKDMPGPAAVNTQPIETATLTPRPQAPSVNAQSVASELDKTLNSIGITSESTPTAPQPAIINTNTSTTLPPLDAAAQATAPAAMQTQTESRGLRSWFMIILTVIFFLLGIFLILSGLSISGRVSIPIIDNIVEPLK